MKSIKLLLVAVVLTMATLSSCTKNETYNVNIDVENVTVQFNPKELITKVEKAMQKQASLNHTPSSDVVHELPTSYKAYFVSLETKGTYTEGQVVKTVDVSEGSNTLVIPALKYKVVVSNYTNFTGSELSWETNLESKLPTSADKIYLIGEKEINYADSLKADIDVKNPYAAIMINNNMWLNGIPTHYDNSNKEYKLINGSWYVLYIRNAKGIKGINTGVPIITNQNTYTMLQKAEPNTIYEYTFNGAGNDVNGNFIVNTEEVFRIVIKQIIDL